MTAMRPRATLAAVWKCLMGGNAALHHILLPGCSNERRWTRWPLLTREHLVITLPFPSIFFPPMHQKPVTSLQFLFLYVPPSVAPPLACIDQNKRLVQSCPAPWYPPTASLNYTPVMPVAFSTTLIPHYVLSSPNIPHYQSLEHICALYTALARFVH